jgi:hypothetical protein
MVITTTTNTHDATTTIFRAAATAHATAKDLERVLQVCWSAGANEVTTEQSVA